MSKPLTRAELSMLLVIAKEEIKLLKTMNSAQGNLKTKKIGTLSRSSNVKTKYEEVK